MDLSLHLTPRVVFTLNVIQMKVINPEKNHISSHRARVCDCRHYQNRIIVSIKTSFGCVVTVAVSKLRIFKWIVPYSATGGLLKFWALWNRSAPLYGFVYRSKNCHIVFLYENRNYDIFSWINFQLMLLNFAADHSVHDSICIFGQTRIRWDCLPENE